MLVKATALQELSNVKAFDSVAAASPELGLCHSFGSLTNLVVDAEMTCMSVRAAEPKRGSEPAPV